MKRTKYKPVGYSDAVTYDTLDEAITAAKRSMGKDAIIEIMEFQIVAEVASRSITQFDVTYKQYQQ